MFKLPANFIFDAHRPFDMLATILQSYEKELQIVESWPDNELNKNAMIARGKAHIAHVRQEMEKLDS